MHATSFSTKQRFSWVVFMFFLSTAWPSVCAMPEPKTKIWSRPPQGKIFRERPRIPLVGGWTNPFEKYDRQNGFIFPKVRGEKKKYLKPPPRIPCGYSLRWWRKKKQRQRHEFENKTSQQKSSEIYLNSNQIRIWKNCNKNLHVQHGLKHLAHLF